MDIRKILEIDEIYDLQKKLAEIMPHKHLREEYFDRIIANGADIKRDFIRDIYQEEAAQRKPLKQDYTPSSLCDLFFHIANPDKNELFLDECAGTGSLAIAFISNGCQNCVCVEKSSTVFIMLLFNLTIRNISGYAIRQDILTGSVAEIFRLTRGDKYSDIQKTDILPENRFLTAVSNPPYSLGWSGTPDIRTEGWGTPPKSKADYMFVLDIMHRLGNRGSAYVLLPHGVLFRNNTEALIRQQLVCSGYLNAVIGLPDNMFMNTQILVVMLCLSKIKSNDVWIADFSRYAVRQGKVNVLENEKIHEIAEACHKRQYIQKTARRVSLEEIRENEFNLNIPRYIDTFEPEELPDVRELVKSILDTDREIRETEIKIARMMQELTGEDYRNIFGEVMQLWNSADTAGRE